ncbi:MAG TPA: hypothetical protein VGS20_11300 [Candidatus Acidoferrales bacterium]|nr:hypothetical protein [Candidatus Acidoferrales bacterium]
MHALRTRRAFFLFLLLASPWTGIAAQGIDPRLYDAMRWRLIGPYRGGRTVAITGVPGRPNLFYMGMVNGGVWKSDDAGRTWTPIFDGQPTGSVGAVAVAASDPNILYVGSGEGLQRPDLSTGDGIYKSTDAGNTWTHLGLRDGQQIPAILVDPHDPNRLFAAVLGHPYGANPERGVFRSVDGGRSWKKLLDKGEDVGAVDLAFDPGNSQILYAALWAARRPPWSVGNPLEGPGSGLYKSTDGGDTWRQLGGGLPGWDHKLGRIGIGIAPSDPNRIYAWVAADAETGGIYRSEDAGQSWTRVNHEPRIWGRGSDFACLRVDPRNPEIVYAANTSTYRSTDAGAHWAAIKGAPGGDDYHTVWINPENPAIIALASDQGVAISVNGGRTWSSWYNQPTAQFYHVTTDNRFPYWVYGGQQESGSAGVESRGDSGEITFANWHTVGAEEYAAIAPDPLHPGVVYGGKVTRYDEATHQTADVSPVVLRDGKYRFNRTAPLVFSPADPHALYLGSNVVFKTTDGGHSWEIVSPDLTRADPGTPAGLGIFSASDPARGHHRGVIYALAPSPLDAHRIWAGTDDGLIWLTRDGRNWQNVTPPQLTPWSKVSILEASHFSPETAYAAVNRFRLDDWRPFIYRTSDGGKTWRKITTGIPDDEPVNVVREDPLRRGLLFAGTERSVYVSFDDGVRWQSLQLNLPHSSNRDLWIHDADLVVATHGRSLWILDDISPLRQLTAQLVASPDYLFRPRLTYRVRRSTNTDTPLPPEEPAGQNPPDGAILYYWLGAQPAGAVTLEILDAAGKLVRRYSSADRPQPMSLDDLNVPTYWVRQPQTLSALPGMHRFVWDLRAEPPESVFHGYPISAIPHDTPREPQGVLVPPGRYTARLLADGRAYPQSFDVRIDPRVRATQADLEAQFVLAGKIAGAMNRSYDALGRTRALAAKLQRAEDQARRDGQGEASAAIAALERKLTVLAGGSGGPAEPGRAAGQGGDLAGLNRELTGLLVGGEQNGGVEAADVAPTLAEEQAFAELNGQLSGLLSAWRQIRTTELPRLNEQFHLGIAP